MSSRLNQNLYRRQMFKNLCQVGMNICKPIPKPMTIIIQIHVPKHNFFFIKPVPKRIFNGIYYTSKRMDNILKPITKRVPGTYHQICTKRATDISRARVRTICYKSYVSAQIGEEQLYSLVHMYTFWYIFEDIRTFWYRLEKVSTFWNKFEPLVEV